MDKISILQFFKQYFRIKNPDGTISEPTLTDTQEQFLKAREAGMNIHIRKGRGHSSIVFQEKGSKIIRIAALPKDYYNIKGYAIFEDIWIRETDSLFHLETNKEWKILDYKVIQDYICYAPDLIQYGVKDVYRYEKRAAIKFEETPKVGDIFVVRNSLK